MKNTRLSSGFLVQDLEGAEEPSITSSGMVRLAPKILPYGAEQLARAETYLYAANKMKVMGASAGINSIPEDRQENISAFLQELKPQIETQNFLPWAGKGLLEADLETNSETHSEDGDPRAKIRLQDLGGCTLAEYCVGISAVTAMDELLGGIGGKSVVIEGFNKSGLGALDQIEKLGAKLTGISTAKESLFAESGIDAKNTVAAYKEHGDDFIGKLGNEAGGEPKPAKAAMNMPADVFLAGSKMGAIDHKAAEKMEAAALGSLHQIPYTTKALFILNRNGVVVPPDFLCLSGMIYSSWTDLEEDTAVIQSVEEKTREIVRETRDMEKAVLSETGAESEAPSLFLAGCRLAEDFLQTWREKLPFGRPLA